MTEPLTNQVDDDDLSPFERKLIFDEIYDDKVILNADDELFKKNSKELAIESTPYRQYYSKLAAREEKRKLDLAAQMFYTARSKFIEKSGGNLFDPFLLNGVCVGLGPLLFDFVDHELSDAQKVEITQKITEITGNDPITCKNLLTSLSLNQINFQNTLTPVQAQISTEVSSENIKISSMICSEEEINDFNQYIQIAKYNDLNEGIFNNIYSEINSLTQKFYLNEIISASPSVHSFASIVGPSLMGKTQFAFSLAQFHPVFYVNFAQISDLQNIYQAFSSISSTFKTCLLHDIETLECKKIQTESDHLADVGREIKLETIGLLWYFVKKSTEFEFDGTSEWFEYYVKERTIQLEKLSICDYLEKLSKPANGLC